MKKIILTLIFTSTAFLSSCSNEYTFEVSSKTFNESNKKCSNMGGVNSIKIDYVSVTEDVVYVKAKCNDGSVVKFMHKLYVEAK